MQSFTQPRKLLPRLFVGLALCCAAASAVFGFARTSTGQTPIVGVASVIDGDTIDIHGTRIRLHGIDAPESQQECAAPDGKAWRCGQQAALALSEEIGRGLVSCAPQGRDRYGRTIAVCSLGGADLNRWLVLAGWAVAYRHYSQDYVRDEEAAKAAKRGIWVGAFTMPWDWRAEKR
jgi:endonuclease YncB( thermonuclease family)